MHHSNVGVASIRNNARKLLRFTLWKILSIALLIGSFWPTAVTAQTLTPPPIVQAFDKNGVSWSSGEWQVDGPTVSIGQPNQGGISYHVFFPSDETQSISYSATSN